MESFRLLTSTRFDPFLATLKWNNDQHGPSSFLLLRYHFDRLLSAVSQHGWQINDQYLTYRNFISACQNALSEFSCRGNQATSAAKIRITLSPSGVLHASATPVQPFIVDPTTLASLNSAELALEQLRRDAITLYPDSRPTSPSLFTITKTTNRTTYDDARQRISQPSATADVLMYNLQGLITETSIFNVAFYRLSRWITPAASTGCLAGVFRRFLLDAGHIHEDLDGILTKSSIQPDEWILLFNSVQGCRLGKVTNFVEL